MVNDLRKAFLLGLGVLSYSEQKYSEILEDFMKQGEAKEKEGEEFVKVAKEKFEENRKKKKKRLQEEVKKLVSSMGLVTKDELNKVKKDVDTLKKKLKSMESKKVKSEGGKK
ncbi:MAG: hypothetical protein HQK84_12710 [Nitrospinae bacterium]|nr:hypothetical protein [Nitrospinota bacterium]